MFLRPRILNHTLLNCGYIFKCSIFTTRLDYKIFYFATAVFTILKMIPVLYSVQCIFTYYNNNKNNNKCIHYYKAMFFNSE